MKVLIVLALLLPGFVGCASLGLATPSSFDEKLANAYGVHTAVVSATATALSAGTITSAEASQVQTQERSARAMLDTAKSIEQTNPTGASNDLTLAVTALTALQTYLNNQKGK
jgi:hypothetical protein